MKHIFIINPIAGVKDSTPMVLEKIKELSEEIECVVYETKCHGDAIKYVKDYVLEHKDESLRFYACGGDGTLNEVINGVVGYDNVEVACVPIGSGNDFIKFFEIDKNTLQLKDIVNGKAVQVDLLKVNDNYSINVFNIGIDAKVVVKQAKLKKLPLISGPGAYKLGVLLSILGPISNNFKVKVDDEEIFNGKGTLCAVANSKCYGGGYICAPIADVTDGLLDVCFVKKVSRFTFASLIKIYKQGKHLEDPRVLKYIIYKQAKKVELEIDKKLPYSIDGELFYSDKVTIEVLEKVLKFVIPQANN